MKINKKIYALAIVFILAFAAFAALPAAEKAEGYIGFSTVVEDAYVEYYKGEICVGVMYRRPFTEVDLMTSSFTISTNSNEPLIEGVPLLSVVPVKYSFHSAMEGQEINDAAEYYIVPLTELQQSILIPGVNYFIRIYCSLNGVSSSAQGSFILSPLTLTFELNGGVGDLAQIYNKWEMFRAADPVRAGYTFDGWYSDPELTQKYTPDEVNSSFTLYAKWTINQYTVTYDTNGYSVPPAKTADYGTTYTLPVPTRINFTFEGWYTTSFYSEASKITSEYYTVPANDITLYAKWASVFAVTYDTNGGAEIPAYSGLPGVAYTLPTPVKSGFIFDGWYTTATFAEGTKCSASYPFPWENITLYAKWVPKTYTVTFYVDGEVYATLEVEHGAMLK